MLLLNESLLFAEFYLVVEESYDLKAVAILGD